MEQDPTLEWLATFRDLHRPRLLMNRYYPPTGTRATGEVDAILYEKDQEQERLVAVEVTRCYRGDRATGEAKQEEHVFGSFCEWLTEITPKCIDVDGYRIAYQILFARDHTLDLLRPVLHEWVTRKQRKGAGSELVAIISQALRDAQATRQAQPIHLLASASSDLRRLLNETGSQVYVQRMAAQSGPDYEFDFRVSAEVPNDGTKWVRPYHLTFGISKDGVIQAIEDKCQGLGQYRAVASQCGALSIWLLLVAEHVDALVLKFILDDADGSLKAALSATPQFNEVYLLAQGNWLPDGWNLKRDGLDYRGGPIWKLFKLWPKGKLAA